MHIRYTFITLLKSFLPDVNNARENAKKHSEKPSVSDADISLSKLNNCHSNSDDVVYRRQRSVENNNGPQLETISEEDRRKSLIQMQMGDRDVNERLQIYVRSNASGEQDSKRSASVEATKPSVSQTTANETASLTKVHNDLRHNKSVPAPEMPSRETPTNNHDIQTSKRKEIDADNIETPPVTRRIISSPTSTLVTVNRPNTSTAQEIKTNEAAVTNLNDLESSETPGHFDRYSMVRRTRRYKRPTDYSSGNEEQTSAKDSSEENSLNQKSKPDESKPQLQKEVKAAKPTAAPQPEAVSSSPKIDTKLEKPKRAGVSARTITKLEKVGRHISSINQEDVQEALRNLKSPTDAPERLWSPPREILSQRGNLATTTANGCTIIKVSNHELNDEGFEETQSLVSDTPSHGKESTNSSCNEILENNNNKQSQKSMSQKTTPIQKISSRLADRLQISRLRSSSKSQSQPSTTMMGTNTANRRTPSASASTSIDRSRNTRMPNGQLVQGPASSTAAAHMSQFTNNAIRRATTMRKPLGATEPIHSSGKRDVERSSSRNSLRSSRSSINSATSTNTVKRMPMGGINKSAPLQTVSVDSSPSKRPLTTQNLKTTASSRLGGIPASRSSSSGSSVGPNIMVVRSRMSAAPQRHVSHTNLGGSTSFKENQSSMGSSRPQMARSAILVKATITSPQTAQRPTTTSRSSSNTRNVSSFMRPTASSVTKRSK